MKKLFFVGVVGLILFEIANVYFIMPLPGSQRLRSIELAYFLYSYRWFFRFTFGVFLLLGFAKAYKSNRWVALALSFAVMVACYLFNFRMAADEMFYQPEQVLMKGSRENRVKKDRIILGIAIGNEAKAYPIQFIGYHHQVLDTIAGKPIMVTYCTVCRTGRIFESIVNGKSETFRLVGMDHFNAMFEDQTTKSWWRQANGESLIGELKGTMLPELDAQQMTLQKWLALYPHTKIMQADTNFNETYEKMSKYELGHGNSDLTKTDSLSWKDKSWVVGIELGGVSKAFDWNRLKKERVINDKVGHQPVVVVLAADNKSFVAFERVSFFQKFTVKGDSLVAGGVVYDMKGLNKDKSPSLKKVKAYQEFWHSWKTFHPKTQRY